MEKTVVKTLSNNIVIKETIALLQEGRRVVLSVKGNSMLPFIIGGKRGTGESAIAPESGGCGAGLGEWHALRDTPYNRY